MRVPSYDDLTPSIPDVTTRETLAQVERILPPLARDAKRPADRGPCAGIPGLLFACLRATDVEAADAANPLGALAAIARDFSPRIERHGMASVVLDVSGLTRLLGDAQAIGAALSREIGNVFAPGRREGRRTIRVAVAPTQTSARLLAIARPGLTVETGDVAAALAPLPAVTLRTLLGDRRQTDSDRDERILDTFRRWGLTTLGEIAALPASDLSERMGQHGLLWQELARGTDREPLVPDPGVPRYRQSMELEWPIDTLEPLSFVFARLLDPLAAALERADRAAAALRLELRLVDRMSHVRVLQLPTAIRDAKVLRTLLLLDLESHPPPAGIDVVAIEIDPAPGRIVQYSLLERATPSPETLATLTARLGALVGERRCGSAALADTHRPDGFEMRPFALAGSRAKPFDAPAHGILRRYRPPIAVRVALDRGRPVRVAIDRRGMPGGHVEQQAGPWRTSGAWWDGAGCWDRDEWDVSLSDGSLCRLFFDRLTRRWFLDGVLD